MTGTSETMLQSRPDILDGAVCFIGTRIPVTAVWSFAAAGYGPEAIREEYPSLTLSQIEAMAGLVQWVTEENPT